MVKEKKRVDVYHSFISYLSYYLFILLPADLINVGYIVALSGHDIALHFFMTSPMTLDRHKIDNYVITASLKSDL